MLNKNESTHLMRLPSNRRETSSEQSIKTKLLWAYFCFGFLWSTFICLSAFLVCQLFWSPTEIKLECPIPTPEEKAIELPENRPCEKRLLGGYRLFENRDISKGQFSKLTHVVFISLLYQPSGVIDFWDQHDKGRFLKMNEEAKLYNVKRMFTLEVKPDVRLTLPSLMEDSNKRKSLVHSIVSFIRAHDLHGVNIHWEHPKTKIVERFILALAKDLRSELATLARQLHKKDSYLLSWVFERHEIQMNFDELLKYVDFINIETDNYYASWHPSPWNQLTGPATPLYGGHEKGSKDNLDGTMQYYACLTGKPHLINAMLSFSGRTWRNVIPPRHSDETLWMKAGDKDGGIHGYPVFYRDHRTNGWDSPDAKWNNESKTLYLWNAQNQTYQAFDNPRSFEEKVKYVNEKNIGGYLIWSIHEDDLKEQTLLNVLYEGNICSNKNNTYVNYRCEGIL